MLSNDDRKTSLYFLGFSSLIIVFLLIYMKINQSFPFYFMWDMDHAVNIDMMLIHGGSMPTHINHPGFGMYLITFFTQKIAYYIDYISILNMDELSYSLNPIAVVAESVSFIRVQSPFLVIAIVVFLWLSLINLFKPSKLLSLFILLILGLQSSLWYHSSMIRTGLYAVFFWSLALLLVSYLVGSKNYELKKNIAITIGIFLGLSFLTKLQSFFYIVSIPLLTYYSFFASDKNDDFLLNDNFKFVNLTFYVSLFNLIIVMLYFVVAYNIDMSPSIIKMSAQMGMKDFYEINLLGIGYLSLSVILSGMSFYFKRRGNVFPFIQDVHSLISYMLFGFTISFLTHFFIYKDVNTSFLHFVYDFKVLFIRKNQYQTGELLTHTNEMLNFIRYYPFLLIATVASIVLSMFVYMKDKRKVILIAIISLVIVIDINVGARFRLRDTIWVEIILIYFNLILLLSVYKEKLGKTIKYMSLGIIFLLFYSNISTAASIFDRTELNFNLYGFRKSNWTSGVLANWLYPYEKIIKNTLTHSSKTQIMAFESASQFKRNYFDSNFIVYNGDVDQRFIGVLATNFPVHITDTKHKINRYPRELEGALLLDVQNVPLIKKRDLKEHMVNKKSDSMGKLGDEYIEDEIILVPRSDLHTLLFVADENNKLPVRCNINKYSGEIVTSNGIVEKRYEGFLIEDLCRVEKGLMKDWFIVLSRYKIR